MKLNGLASRETMSVAQAGEVLGLSRVVVWRLLRDEHLDGYQRTPYRGSIWAVYVDSVEKFLQEREG